jgi:hypothetical protein
LLGVEYVDGDVNPASGPSGFVGSLLRNDDPVFCQRKTSVDEVKPEANRLVFDVMLGALNEKMLGSVELGGCRCHFGSPRVGFELLIEMRADCAL